VLDRFRKPLGVQRSRTHQAMPIAQDWLGTASRHGAAPFEPLSGFRHESRPQVEFSEAHAYAQGSRTKAWISFEGRHDGQGLLAAIDEQEQEGAQNEKFGPHRGVGSASARMRSCDRLTELGGPQRLVEESPL